MALDLKSKVIECLKQNPEQKFTAREIANWIFETYPDECRIKQKSSTATVTPLDNDTAFLQQIAAEIAAIRPRLQKKNPYIKTTEGRPRQWYFTEKTDDDEIDQAESAGTSDTCAESATVSGKPAIKEHDLYPMLAEFLWSELEIYSKRIDEKRSHNSGGTNSNEWLYPDLVGMEDLSQDWHQRIKDCVKAYSDKTTKLWSFEVKTLINRSNVRKSFFQTVSNSSWANFSYLVAGEIAGADTLKELRILASLHGIGFISLDTSSPSESQIMIPARERSEIDWNIANRLAEANKDFLNYVKLVHQFYQTGDIRSADWDAT